MEEKWQLFKNVMGGCEDKVCGMRHVGSEVRKGNEWCCEKTAWQYYLRSVSELM